MTSHPIVPGDIEARFEVHDVRNGLAVLSAAHPEEWRDVLTVLRTFQLLKSDIEKPGGRKSPIAEKLDGHFYRLGWAEREFDTRIVVDKFEYKAPTTQSRLF